MPIIFGWGRQTIRQIGIAFKYLCSNCHNEEYWILQKITTWFTVFFIPIIPYSIKYFLSCPVCKYGLTLNQTQLEEIRPTAELNQQLVDGRVTQDEYQLQMNQLNSDLTPANSNSVQTEVVEGQTITVVEDDKKLSYCDGCGSKTTKELMFCGNCGTKVTSK